MFRSNELIHRTGAESAVLGGARTTGWKHREQLSRQVILHKVFSAALCVLCALCASGLNAAFAQSGKFSGIGRSATPAELKAWDIDVRPDFKGLPKGQGSVKQGEILWEAQCASCHGTFGESSEVFTPIAGGILPADIKTGRVSGLLPGANQPQRTTVMKLSTLSTLWDYINRAMPWNAPKSLSANEVYAATAYILHMGNILPAEFILSDANIREVQGQLPNRNGMTTAHALWPGREFGGIAGPDVKGSRCMSNCLSNVAVKNTLPDYARNAHGNLADQSRHVGPSRGADTTLASTTALAGIPAPNMVLKQVPAHVNSASLATEMVAKEPPGSGNATASVMPVLQKNNCLACHGMDSRLVGPSFKDISRKYGDKDRLESVNYLSGKIKSGSQGVWGAIAMPAQALSQDESVQLARWLLR